MANMTHDQAMQTLRDLQNIKPILDSLDQVIPSIASLLNKSQEAQDFLLKAYHQLDQKKAAVEGEIATMTSRKAAAEQAAKDAEAKTLLTIADFNKQVEAAKAKLATVTDALKARDVEHEKAKAGKVAEMAALETRRSAIQGTISELEQHLASLKAKFA